MSIIETQPASYKGVEFLMLSATTNGGIKDALFEFPNSNRQTVEQLGLKVRAYSMTAIIPHEDYYNKRDALLAALEEQGSGPLDHPTFGKIEDIVARTFTLNERISELGRAEVQITFAISDDIGIPQKAKNSISEVNQDNNTLSDELNIEIADDFEVDTGLLGNFQDAQDLLNNVGDAFNSVVSTVTAVTTTINQVAAQINDFTNNINTLIGLPGQLANSVSNIFSSINGVTSTFESAFSVYANLFGFGDEDIPINKTTAGLTQRAKNRDVINQVMQTSSLGYAYLNAVQIEFQTTDDIDALNTLLEDQYEKIIGNDAFSEDAKRAATDVRTIANQLFDAKRLDAKNVIDIYTHRRPMSEIAYQYYGSTDLTDTLLELNNITNGSFVEGDIKILTE